MSVDAYRVNTQRLYLRLAIGCQTRMAALRHAFAAAEWQQLAELRH